MKVTVNFSPANSMIQEILTKHGFVFFVIRLLTFVDLEISLDHIGCHQIKSRHHRKCVKILKILKVQEKVEEKEENQKSQVSGLDYYDHKVYFFLFRNIS